MQYQIMLNLNGQQNGIKKIEDTGQIWCIPIHEDNKDYQEYLKWVAEGNTPEAAE